MTSFEFLLLTLATFRLTRLLVFDRIFEFIRRPFLTEVEEDGEVYIVPKENGLVGWIGELISCYWCTGVWSAALLYACYMFVPYSDPLIYILGIAGVAALIEWVVQFRV
ncbi:sporulation protein [Bacillus coahuilensis m2-6]|uniref:DUF1360 domain-containing protein n=1 Tax=Bacillus coahuilensis TaxID=408580 RepID=UPI0001850F63|nr:DUF1360 domain-containing protein [Bacillus coahuilensis]KUP09008.1 sporulation protein [Bacillus coahuilensis m2-6]